MNLTWPPPSHERFEISLGDALYPEALSMSPRPPAVLRGYGDPDALGLGLAIIGARKATPYGLKAASIFSGWAASAGYTIISGAAIGCDTAAHRAALDSGGRTVAVLGCGADVSYPRDAAALLEQISRTGAVVSELEWGHPPAKWTFRARNRIIAGLAGALLVLEAGLGSGTFITADAALEAGREVMVIPGSILAPECAGANRLFRQGATPITDVSELSGVLVDILGPPQFVESAEILVRGSDKVLAALRTNPMRPDDLARLMGLDVVQISRRVGALEAAGVIAKYRDGRYGPC